MGRILESKASSCLSLNRTFNHTRYSASAMGAANASASSLDGACGIRDFEAPTWQSLTPLISYFGKSALEIRLLAGSLHPIPSINTWAESGLFPAFV